MKREVQMAISAIAGVVVVGSLSGLSQAAPASNPDSNAFDHFVAPSPNDFDNAGQIGGSPGVGGVVAGPGPTNGPGGQAIPLPGPALMGVVGLGAAFSLRRRWNVKA